MEWFETENVNFIRSTAAKFAQKELAGYEDSRKESRNTNRDWTKLLQKGRELGFFSCTIPEKMGGVDLDTLSQVVLIAELAAGCCDFAVTVAGNNIALGSVIQFCDEEQGKSAADLFFDEAAEKQPALFSIAFPRTTRELSESQIDYLVFPDPERSIRTLIVDAHDGFRLIDSATISESKLDSSAVNGVPDLNCRRFRKESEIDLGPLIQLTDLDKKAQYIRSRQNLFFAAAHYGSARAAQSVAVDYAMERSQTGRLIIEHQQVRRVLVHSEMLLQAMESYLLRMAAYDGAIIINGLDVFGLCFRFVCGSAEKICLDAIQTLGGYGYMKDYGLEKRLRDCKALTAIAGKFSEQMLGE